MHEKLLRPNSELIFRLYDKHIRTNSITFDSSDKTKEAEYKYAEESYIIERKKILEGEFKHGLLNGNGKITIDEFWRSHHVVVETNDGNIKEFKDEGNEFVYEAKHIQDCLNKNLIESPLIKEEDSVQEVENIEYLYKKWHLI